MGKLHFFFAQYVLWGHLMQQCGYVCTYSAEHVQESSKHCHGSAGSVRHAVHQSEQTSFRVSMIQELRFEELTH